MKLINFFRAVIVMVGLVLSACAPAAAPSADSSNVGGGKAVSEVIFVGVIESMDGDQWVIDSHKITVDPSVLRDGPFVVGDTVKVEASVAEDGSVVAQRVETPSASDLAGTDDNASDDNANSNDNNSNDDNGNGNDANGNINDDNSNADNSNDDNGNDDNSNDDNSNDDNGNDDNSNDDNGNDDNGDDDDDDDDNDSSGNGNGNG